MNPDIFADMAKKATAKWTKQKKKEERNANAQWNRYVAMTKSTRTTVKEVAYDYMERAYMKASANGTLPAVARQVMYAARPYILKETGEETLDGPYFQTLLKDYMYEFPSETAGWTIAYDPRGNFHEPHTEKSVPLGTLDVREYVAEVRNGLKQESELPKVDIDFPTIGHKNRISAVLFIEKEGFLPLLRKAEIAEKYDVAIMSTKGLSTTAARELVDELCGDVPLLIVRDFDKAGFSIAATVQNDSKHHTFYNDIEAIDLGLRLDDAEEWHLESEPVTYGNSARWRVRNNLQRNGATMEEINFLCANPKGRRVELNAFSSDQFIAWLEFKLEENGVAKVIPDEDTLDFAYRRAYRLTRLQKLIEDNMEKLKKEAEKLDVPDDLKDQIREVFEEDPSTSWDKAINQILEDADL